MIELSPRRRRLVDARGAISQDGSESTVRELCKSLGVESTSAMIKHLEAIARKGLTVRESSTARALRVTELGEEEAVRCD